MDDDLILAGLDLGSTRFRAVVAEPDGKGGVALIGHASLPARGMVRGELSDLSAAASAIRAVLSLAADEAEVDIDRLAVSVGGDHVRSLGSRGVLALEGAGASIGPAHLEMAMQRVQAMDVPFDRVILHCLPVEYTLDDRSGLKNPLGMVGARLSLDAHIITGTQSCLSATDRAVQMAGYRADPLVFGPCATGCYLIGEQEREQGCLLVDIGAESTQYALFYRGRMRQSGVVAVGGNHVTRDLAYGLEVGIDEAEHIKRREGTALRSRLAVISMVAGSDTVPCLRPAEQRKVAAICEPRQQEILELVAQGLQWGITRPALAAGAILTGGGSRLPATEELAEQVFTLRATTRRAPGDDYAEEPDTWAAALGLAQHALDAEPPIAAGTAVMRSGLGILDNLRRWIDRLV